MDPSNESFDSSCARFERAWQGSVPPDLLTFLGERGWSADADDQLLARELVCIDLEFRWRFGDRLGEFQPTLDAPLGPRPSAADYSQWLYGESAKPTPSAWLAIEYRLRKQAGDSVGAEAIKEAAQVRPDLLEAIARIELELTRRRDDHDTIDWDARDHAGLHVRCPHCHNPIELVDDAPLHDIDCPSCGSTFSVTSDRYDTRHAPVVQQLGHFELIERLGMGAFGEVWKARDTMLDRTVAVKLPRKGQLSPEEEEQFFREARSAAQLRHPHIVPVHEVGRDGVSIYIVSEFIRGVTLAEMLEDGQVTHRESVKLLLRIVGALAHAHLAGVVHRDLKPQNIMIDDAGEPHLMDFGLAKREAGEVTMTVDGAILGTPAYMSPEQALGQSRRVGPQSDIYSVGVILFQMLTGELPFRGTTRMLLHKVINDEAPSPRRLDNRIPRDLETICLKCLEKAPTRRYLSATELAADLEHYLNDEPIAARPVTAIERGRRWVRRQPRIAALLFTVCLLLLAIAVGGPLAAMRERELRIAAQRSEQVARVAETTALEAKNELRTESARVLFSHGLAEYDAGRIDAGCKELYRAWAFAMDGSEQKLAYARVLTDRLTRGQRSWVIARQPGSITGLAASSTSKLVAVAFRQPGSAKVKLLDAYDLRQLGDPLLHSDDPVYAVAFSHKGDRLATGSFDKNVRQWTVSNQQLLDPIIACDEHLSSVSYSPDDTRILATTSQYFETGGIIGHYDAGVPRLAAVWNAETGALVGAPMQAEDSLRTGAWSPDGTRIATLSDDRRLVMWDAQTNQPIGHPIQMKERSLAVAFHPDGKRFVAGGFDGKISEWQVSTLDALGDVDVGAKVISLAYTDDGRFLCIGMAGQARMVDAMTGSDVVKPLPHELEEPVACEPVGSDSIVTVQGDCIRRWDLTIGRRDRELEIDDCQISSLQIDATGKRLLARSYNPEKVIQLEIASWRTIETPAEYVKFHGFSADGKRMVSASDEYTLRVWDLAENREAGPPFKMSSKVERADMNHNGSKVFVSCEDGSATLWDTTTGRTIGNTKQLPPQAQAYFDPQGVHFVTVARDSTKAQLWKVSNAEPLGDGLPVEIGAECCAFGPDGSWLIIAERADSARIWKVPEGGQIGRTIPLDGYVTEMFVTRMGDRILVRAEPSSFRTKRNTVRLWDSASGGSIGETIRSDIEIGSALMMADGSRIVTSDERGTIQMWDGYAGCPVAMTIDVGSEVEALALSPEGDALYTVIYKYNPRRSVLQRWRLPAPIAFDGGKVWFERMLGSQLTSEFGSEFKPLREETLP